MLAYKDDARVHLMSRNALTTRDGSPTWPRQSKLSARTLVLDDEVAIYDQQLRSRASTGYASPTPTRSPRRRSSWPSTCCTRTAAT
jgi:hypothetical protein